MITRLDLENFKCFQSQSLELGNLSVLAGMNGSGKSSILQALLMLRQSSFNSADRWSLNGRLTRLGTGADILFAQASTEQISIGIATSQSPGNDWLWSARYERSADVLQLITFPDPARASEESLFSAQFNYLAADRIGPRLVYDTSDEAVEHRRDVGTRGEFAVHYLARYGDEPVMLGAGLHARAASHRLADQVEAWLGEISPGARVILNPHPEMDAISVGFAFQQGKDVSNTFRATNVGFGLAYSLSLLVTLFSARPGALLLIENPEAHIHPQGQVVLGKLLAAIAASGVQLIVETHSDHIVNGIRLSVFERMCEADAVRIHFFTRDPNAISGAARVDSPAMSDDGRIDYRPAGFFDQWDRSLETLLGPRPE
jgi:predicted ATPase